MIAAMATKTQDESLILRGELARPAVCPKHGTPLTRCGGPHGPYLACSLRPTCDVVVTHCEHDGRWRATTREIREARMAAHRAFDALWQRYGMNRRKAYRWLAGELGLRSSECHFKHFTVAACELTVRLVGERLARMT